MSLWYSTVPWWVGPGWVSACGGRGGQQWSPHRTDSWWTTHSWSGCVSPQYTGWLWWLRTVVEEGRFKCCLCIKLTEKNAKIVQYQYSTMVDKTEWSTHAEQQGWDWGAVFQVDHSQEIGQVTLSGSRETQSACRKTHSCESACSRSLKSWHICLVCGVQHRELCVCSTWRRWTDIRWSLQR